MITFTRIPVSCIPLGGEIRYAVATDAAQRIGIRILRAAETAARSSETLENGVAERPGPTDPPAPVVTASDAVPTGTAPSAEGDLLGAKRFVGVVEAAFDAGPYLRRAVRFAPTAGGTGFCDAGSRTLTATVEATATGGAVGAAALGTPAIGTAAGPADVEASAGATDATAIGGAEAAAIGAAAAGSADVEASAGAIDATAEAVGTPVPETSATVGADAAETVQTVVAPARTFLPCAEAPVAPALLTAMPRERLIAPGECDELTLLHDGPLTITVTAEGGDATAHGSGADTGFAGKMSNASAVSDAADGVKRAELRVTADNIGKSETERVGPNAAERASVRTFRSGEGVLHLFRIDTRDFPGAERLTVDAGGCGRVAYTLLPAPEGARRVAWRTAEGSVEHYTFPVEKAVRLKTCKTRACGCEGVAATIDDTESRLSLESACEGRGVLRALAGLTASPQVWLAEGDRYTAVDVLTDEAEVPGPGMPGTFGLLLRPTCKPSLPWN